MKDMHFIDAKPTALVLGANVSRDNRLTEFDRVVSDERSDIPKFQFQSRRRFCVFAVFGEDHASLYPDLAFSIGPARVISQL
jgi:hypothetical protein